MSNSSEFFRYIHLTCVLIIAGLLAGCHDDPASSPATDIPIPADSEPTGDHRPGSSGNDSSSSGNSSESSPFEAVGDGTEQSPGNVAWLLNNSRSEDEVWIEGYVVGYVDGVNAGSGIPFQSRVRYGLPTSESVYDGRNLILADTPETETLINYDIPPVVPLALYGEYARLWNLLDNPERLSMKIRVRSLSGKIYGHIGLSDPTLLLVIM